MKHSGAVAVLTAAITLVLAAVAGPVTAHEGNPDFRSIINSITPERLSEGLKARIVNFDDHVVLENRSGEEVEVLGYRGEPYARISADGKVEVNINSPTHYENQDRYADVKIPDRADAEARPAWKQVGDEGVFEWHDHRSHYMSKGIPPQVKDRSTRTKIASYEIPLLVGGAPAQINGTLWWHGEDSKAPVLPFVLLGVAVLAGTGFLVIRRRRA